MICYYRNSNGQEINLMRYPYRLITADFFTYEWEESTFNGKIYGFSRSIWEKDVRLDVFCRAAEFPDAMNALEDIISIDVLKNTPGKIYVNGEYLSCYIKGVQKDEWEAGIYTVVTLKVISDKPFWINESSEHFYAKDSILEDEKSEFLDYPYDYSYDYTVSDIGSQIWNIDHVVACPFLLTIYGPVTDPRILIDGRVIEVYTTLEGNEYLILDSRDHTIIKYLSNGTTQNLYNNRYMEESVFDPIGPGPVYVTWTGTFGFDITAYIERNEPRWRSRQA